mmetsp:Transcript_18751/g.26409  ORF Transcript_18751/g.26409 Transcript_18751/m.26409 type:complete len:149 (+) Transcript_18751:160-606(+)
MKLSTTLFIIASVTVTTAAFTIGKRSTNISKIISSRSSNPRSFSSSTVSMAAADFVNTEVTSNDVVIFSKSYCPFCTKTKSLFKGIGVEAKIHELNQMDDGSDIQDALLEMTGQKTVPNVFIKGEHLGGNDNTQAAAKSGKLAQMLGV